jgi:hypothetical protein
LVDEADLRRTQLSGALARSLSVQDVCVNQPESQRSVVTASQRVTGGAWARSMVVVGCARALSLISVLGPEGLRAGDVIGGGMTPLGYALRPLGL